MREPVLVVQHVFHRGLSVTPRPMYPADGRKIPDVYTAPGTLRDELQSTLGTFPLFEFWGPRAVNRIDAMDRRCRDAGRSAAQSDADADLPAASRLRPPTRRAARSGVAATLRDRRGLRRSDRHFERPARTSSCCRSTASAKCRGRALQSRVPAAWMIAFREEIGTRCSIPGRAPHSPSPIIRSPTSTSTIRATQRSACHRRSAWNRVSAGRCREARAHIAHERAGDLIAVAPPMRGSRITTGTTIGGLRISRARSRSTASPDTTRWSCFSIPPIRSLR